MVPHLRKCEHASVKAKEDAALVGERIREREQKKKEDAKQKKRRRALSDVDEEVPSQWIGKKRRDESGSGMRQSELKVFKGIDLPFKADEVEKIRRQFLRATISANFPFRWVANPEVIALFEMFRSKAQDVIPEHRALSGVLLNSEAEAVEKDTKSAVSGKYGTLSYVCCLLFDEQSHSPDIFSELMDGATTLCTKSVVLTCLLT